MLQHKSIVTVFTIAALAAGSAYAGIRGSKHDLGTGGAAQATTAATTEVCVFCHTPHGSNTGVSAPLWNKTLPSTTYTRYSSLGTATLDGEEVPVGSVSLACLSCHDGTQAMDTVINAPGSGGYNAAGSEIDVGAIGTMTGTVGTPNNPGGFIPNLESDLTNDHPISIEYAGGACTNTTADCDPATQPTGDKDFNAVQYASINTNNQWWIDVASWDSTGDGTRDQTGVADTREKSDIILYARTFTGGEGPSVECASCHDPHEDTVRPVSFLRIANSNSDVCLACHIK
jgi:hypothetical protein